MRASSLVCTRLYCLPLTLCKRVALVNYIMGAGTINPLYCFKDVPDILHQAVRFFVELRRNNMGHNSL